ncbi:MAG: prolipoprotein diacylglyceryl transferase family protein [Planctomycetota bacterium]
MSTAADALGRALYGALFCLVAPALAVLWAARLDALLGLGLPLWAGGWGLCALGVLLVLASWGTLAARAGGLPMNAFPPPRFTRAGPYRLLEDPIYVGAVLVAAGAALARGSWAGVFVVTPTLAAACTALVWGHERRSLGKRFPGRPRAALTLPPDDARPPTRGERLWLWTHLFVPWAVLYEAIGHLPTPHALDARLPFERSAQVHVWAELPYASVYLAVLAAPFLARTAGSLRARARTGQIACVLAFTVYLAIPVLAPPRPFEGGGVLGAMLELERADGLAGRAALPSFHVFWTLWAARAWSERAPRAAWLWATVAVAACWLTGMHAVLDLVAGAALFVLSACAPALWRAATRATERLSNGWRERRFGPIRVINHGYFAGAASAAGTLLALALLPPGSAPLLVGVAVVSLVSAGLWGQALVGGRTLKRPFGYFGTVLGLGLTFGVVALSGVELPGAPLWSVAAAVVAATPLTQAIGRLRCMVQGCCHGAPCDERHGIRVVHPRSRVVFLSKLKSVPILPTPLVSIAGNALILPLLLRLWRVEAPAAFVVGAYLVLQGLARFIEEGHRGEAQTQTVGPFRVYQVLAAGMLVAGAAVSCLPSTPVAWSPSLDGADLAAAALVGALHVFAMGVDFPESNRRFSRLV